MSSVKKPKKAAGAAPAATVVVPLPPPREYPVSANPNAWRIGDLASVPGNGLRVMSTFACGGGSSMGYKRAGCTVVAANDIDPEMAAHYQANIKPKHYFLCPIGDLVAKGPDGRYLVDLPEELTGIDILDGSPPCSSFSPAGDREKAWGKQKKFREGQAEQVLNDLFFDYLNLVDRLRPKVSVAENVTGMLVGNAKGYTKAVMARYREIGYRVQLFQVNAADCGVPQARRRVFFVALRGDLVDAGVPPLTIDTPEFKRRHVACEEACDDVQVLTEDELADTKPNELDRKWWALTRPGENYAGPVQRAGLPNSLWNWIRHPRNRPACTLVATHNCMRHWSVMRGLTLREFKRLGSFPDDYQTRSDDTGKYMIGMSVPPKMTEAVARAVCSQWLGARYP